MRREAEFYFNQGFDVLVPTMGGYPGTTKINPSEESTYQDVDAIKSFLADKGVKEAGYHGRSIGGTLAFRAATETDNPRSKEIKTLFVVADQTFTEGGKVMHTAIGNTTKLSGSNIQKFANAKMPKGKTVQLPSGKIATTNGMDNKGRADALKEQGIPVIALAVQGDRVMELNGTNLSKGLTEDCYEMKTVGEKQAQHCASFLDADEGAPRAFLESKIQQFKQSSS